MSDDQEETLKFSKSVGLIFWIRNCWNKFWNEQTCEKKVHTTSFMISQFTQSPTPNLITKYTSVFPLSCFVSLVLVIFTPQSFPALLLVSLAPVVFFTLLLVSLALVVCPRHYLSGSLPKSCRNGGRANYVIESKVQWKPFWLATQLYPQNDWTGWQFPVYYDKCAWPPL